MKKQYKLYLPILILALILSACSTSSESPAAPANDEISEPASAGEGNVEAAPAAEENGEEETSLEIDQLLPEGELGLQMQLSVGTFLLEDSAAAVSAEQAVELLPLWKVVRSLTESDTTARAEIDAVIVQIAELMTAEQLQLIAETELTMEEMAALMEKYGVVPQGAQSDNPGGMPGGGPGMGMGMGMGPGGGGMMSGDISPEMQATMEARQEEMGDTFGVRMGAMWIEPLIELLQERAGG